MKLKKIVIIFPVLILLMSLTYFLLPYPESLNYKRSDVYSYYSFTDRDIKNSPRISNDYFFTYISPDGGQREMSIITFTGGDPAILRDYIKSLGYHFLKFNDNGRESIWQSPSEDHNMMTLWYDKQTQKVILTKILLWF